ncbi:hypothetical protein [Nitrosomonas sp.]|uniref:hypothetical protein n=1 Tax=Nitrosomonas sp. TaxID=42353 RepID=UPI00260F427C|nr:hypothetical protein [Nitrosomonas sp.]MCW5602888.1 hypothetical protein [Nitrosomonas sp.]
MKHKLRIIEENQEVNHDIKVTNETRIKLNVINKNKPEKLQDYSLASIRSVPLNSFSCSRREFILRSGLLALTGVLAQLSKSSWAQFDQSVEQSSLNDTLNGLLAFVVPGSDSYSIHQGIYTTDSGGVDAGVTGSFIFALDNFMPFAGNFSVTVSTILNNVASAINPAVSGPFVSLFANLSFAEKAMVFALLESGQIETSLKPLAGTLLQFAGFLAYSEAGAVDPITGKLITTPLSWILTGYSGPTDGYAEFLGYYREHRKAN